MHELWCPGGYTEAVCTEHCACLAEPSQSSACHNQSGVNSHVGSHKGRTACAMSDAANSASARVWHETAVVNAMATLRAQDRPLLTSSPSSASSGGSSMPDHSLGGIS